MRTEETRAFAVAPGPPSTVEIDAQEAATVTTGLDWWQIVWVPLLLGAGALVQHWRAARAEGRKADADYVKTLLEGYVTQVTDLTKAQAEDRARIGLLERESSRERHIRSRAVRIAHQALDRDDDQAVYIHRREEVRLQHDPEGTETDWVPEIPKHLLDRDWTSRKRAELNALDDLLLDDDE